MRWPKKLVRRHPHVFGDLKVGNSTETIALWNELKKTEKPERQSVLDGVPRALPALMRPEALQKKAKQVGFDWNDVGGALAKVREEIDEVEAELAQTRGEADPKLAAELGDLLFALVNLTRHFKLHAEELLTSASDKFVRRFQAVEEEFKTAGKPMKGRIAGRTRCGVGTGEGEGARSRLISARFGPSPHKSFSSLAEARGSLRLRHALPGPIPSCPWPPRPWNAAPCAWKETASSRWGPRRNSRPEPGEAVTDLGACTLLPGFDQQPLPPRLHEVSRRDLREEQLHRVDQKHQRAAPRVLPSRFHRVDRGRLPDVGRGRRDDGGETSSRYPSCCRCCRCPPLRTWWFLELIDVRQRLNGEEMLMGALSFFEQHPEWLGRLRCLAPCALHGLG